jgi:calmodulin-binding transcription activator
MPTFTQSLSLEFASDYGTGLLGNEADNGSSVIDPVLFSFHGEPKEKLAQQNYLEEKVDGHLRDDLKSNSTKEVPSEETINYPLPVRRTLLDRDESLRKVDSFNRWITKALGEVDDLNMQSSPGISWSADDCGHVIDDTSLSPSLSQDQLYSIADFSPKWAYAESDTEVLILGIIVSMMKGSKC